MKLRRQSDLEKDTLEVVKEVVKQVAEKYPGLKHAEEFRNTLSNQLTALNILLLAEVDGKHPIALVYHGDLSAVRIFLEDGSIDVGLEKDTAVFSPAPPSGGLFR